MWHLYILKCRDKSLYTGITTNLERRLQAHNSKKGSRAIRGRLPARLAYQETCPSRSKALKREAQIKRWSRAEKLAFIKNSKPDGIRVGF